MKIELIGWKETKAALDDLPKKVGQKVVLDVFREVLTPVIDRMRARAPNRTGEYRKGFAVSRKLSSKQRRAARKLANGEIAMYGGAGSNLSHLLEKGTKERRTKRGKRTGRGPALPHIIPVWNSAQSTILRDVGTRLWRALTTRI